MKESFDEWLDRWQKRPVADERSVTIWDPRLGAPDGVLLLVQVPWEYLGIVFKKGFCRWCGKPTGPRATWCKKPSSWGGPPWSPCANAVYGWWHQTKALNRAVFFRDKFTCQICGKTAPLTDVQGRTVPDMTVLHMDHIVPISRGGKTVWMNLQTTCAGCNLIKGAKENVRKPRQQ